MVRMHACQNRGYVPTERQTGGPVVTQFLGGTDRRVTNGADKRSPVHRAHEWADYLGYYGADS